MPSIFFQDAPDPKKARIASKEDLKPSRKRKMPFIKRFEIAGIFFKQFSAALYEKRNAT